MDAVADASGTRECSSRSLPPARFPIRPTTARATRGFHRGSTTIDGLTNGIEYHFAVVVLDEARNPSLVSIVSCTTPETVNDFWDTYTDAGGQAEGGCACAVASGHGAVAGIGLAALALLVSSLGRKRRTGARGGARGKAGEAE